MIITKMIITSKYYDKYNYNYNNQIPDDYTDDYRQELNDYPPPTPMVPIGKITFFFLEYLIRWKWSIDY